MEKIDAFIQDTKRELDVIFDFHAPSVLINTPIYHEGFKGLLNRGCKIRCITEITPDNIGYCKEILKLVTELRHIEGMKGGIAVNRSEYISTSVIETNQPVTELYYTNLKPMVEQGQYIFDTFWRNSVSAISKIKEIEQAKVPEVIESIYDPVFLQNKAVELLRSANKEILVIFSSANAFERQKNAGSIAILEEVGLTKPHIKIRMLTPKSPDNEVILNELSRNINFDYIFIEPIIRVTILVVDRKFSIVVELKDDTKRTIAEAIGQATYSNSTPTVLTYTVLFDALWNQTALYEQLQVHDRMQKEFIDAVAHELRTPLTPIIGLTKHVIDKINDDEQRELLDVVLYNGMKLQDLSENVLAVTKLEGNQLRLSKVVFDLGLLIIEVIKDFELGLDKIRYVNSQYNKKIHFQLDGIDKKYMVYADRYRITQVITNLIDNAVNFILHKVGLVSIVLAKRIENDTNFVTVQIKDNGEGIDPELMSRLFTKFASKSFYGTGLGLYICKEIIEMHQGKIWGINNDDGKGATFSFELRLLN
jgi:two-component system, OmpR family, sensor histidine kinase VicK